MTLPKKFCSEEEAAAETHCLREGQKCPILNRLKGSEFVRKIKPLGRRQGGYRSTLGQAGQGQSCHASLRRSAHCDPGPQERELPTGTLHAMLNQLGLSFMDLE